MTTPTPTTVTLNNGLQIPQIGFGVFQVDPGETSPAVQTALQSGYRLIDTAQGYRNEEGVGQALRETDVPREDIFVTTKLTNSEHGRDKALRAFDGSMQKLGLDVLDLFLIHWPLPMYDEYVETWKAFEELLASGRVRSIGVSNFTKEHLQRLFDETGTVPVINQIELHPRFPQAELREFHAQHGIITESWSPIGQGKGLLDEPVLKEIGEQYGKSPAQVVLRWHVQLGLVAIPKSVTPSRIAENLDVFDFALSDDDLAKIATLETGERIGPDPATASFR
ncbi:diketogulonate reductase-like aldo/keto reductase [Motilibacter rhizosphaerae]|uniref:Diketogulonate reductase-like aldo/keto reductase n=1 Tax=Motilibacter rhizosphaerae TaxID=598652 RepID=A0A4Q7NRV6_9ACTN|nr:aldo/keto reductase [Motilibacter rhizosphaerae]RZS89580.1 diketogulonate reductase-like aldo/keto reductase [Motilibacter rhizosphaerae]